MLFCHAEDFAGRLALSCWRRCASGAVKFRKQHLLLFLVLLLASKLCLIGLVFLKIRKVRKKAAVILSIGAYESQSGAASKAAICSGFCPFRSMSSAFYQIYIQKTNFSRAISLSNSVFYQPILQQPCARILH